MEIPSKYDPSKVESKWYEYWMKHDMFRSVPDAREPYTIVIPPPNVTGVLHMGHMLNNTIQDILIRRARLLGKNACWVPGTDHASIATEAKIVAKLAAEGIQKSSLSREEFLKHAWEWTHKHGGIILEQLKKLGASCDWKRTKFTMDDDMSESVIHVFVDLYRKGLIYRGTRMVNWDPQAKTALSDEEVEYREVQSKLYYVSYPIEGSSESVTIATTRPETILGDTAVCIHPEDPRYTFLKGKRVIVPLVNRAVPVIEDEYVDMSFGTGVLKITPAHDVADYELGLKHHLEVIDIFNEDGTLNEKAQWFTGKDRFVARELVVEELRSRRQLVKEENYVNKVGFSERTHVPIEPRLSVQWFLKMKTLAEPALKNVLNGTIKLHPEKFINTYRHWMENIKDWCISRQLWWGHRIPAWYLPDGSYVVAHHAEEALALAKQKQPHLTAADLKQDEDVLDTWFSSWLWPISVFDGIRNPGNPDIQYYYPTNDLVTAPEILFFWVARMIMAGYEYRGAEPFKNVYLTGIVRDKQRRKMSKSLGNSPEPLDLIAKYSADGVRVGMLLCSPAGNDLLFDESLTEQGRNFCNKIWNAFRLIKSWKTDDSLEQPDYARVACNWFEERLKQAIHQMNALFEEYRLSEAMMTMYKLFWDDFASWFLEAIKPEYQQPMDTTTYEEVTYYFETLLVMLHPFVPFITEELWHLMDERKEGESIMRQSWPVASTPKEAILNDFELARQVITEIRNIRTTKNISPKEKLTLWVNDTTNSFNDVFDPLIIKLGGLERMEYAGKKEENTVSFLVKTTEFYLQLNVAIDAAAEIAALQKELDYTRGFLASVMKKLSNERFVSSAPREVVERERNKQQDAESKIKALEERIALLKK